MSNELTRVRRRRIRRERDHEHAVHPQFDEAHGESEADLVGEAFIRGASPAPSRVASALHAADTGTRARMLNRMQGEMGNHYVQRVAAHALGPAAAKGPLVQREDEPQTGTFGSLVGELADIGRTAGDRALHLGDPIAQIFISVVQTNIASASPVEVPTSWQEKLLEYCKDVPGDAALLLPGFLRRPQYYKGGWIMSLQTDAKAMTLDHSVFVTGDLDIGTYVHEMVHVTQYLAGPTPFLVSYFGLSAATIAKRFIMREPLNYMRSSPHENSAYELEQRFLTWLSRHPL